MKPVLLRKQSKDEKSIEFLKPTDLNAPFYNEEWLQHLIQENPDIIPASEIEACFDTLVPILMEFSLPSGYLDNLFITPDGYPVLVEVKLWKNQESRRKVVAQILEYAKDFSALRYSDLNAEFIKQNQTHNGKNNPLYETVSAYAPDTPDEAIFVDRVSRNLREGRFLLLIVGDGIREELASLAEYLIHHALRYSFGLIQVKIFAMPDGNVIALPSVMAKTQTIERHVTIVHTINENIKIAEKSAVVGERTEKTSLSTDEFFARLEQISPQAVLWLKGVLSRLQDVPVNISIGADYAALIAPLAGGESIILALINLKNKIEFWGVPNKKRKNPEWSKLSKTHLNRLSALVPESFVKVFDSGHMDLYSKETNKFLPITAFIGKEDAFTEALRECIKDAELFFQQEYD